MELDIEDFDALRDYLTRQEHAESGENISFEELPGGVSNRTIRVGWPDGRGWVLKQALAKLRVPADWFSSPERIRVEAKALRCLNSLAPPGTTPPFIFEDAANHLMAMEAIPKESENWKSVLLSGRLVSDHCGIDVAATHFYKNQRYTIDADVLDGNEMVKTITKWLDRFPIISVEDGLAEDDWEHWPKLREAISGRALTLGDDLLCTNPQRIGRAIETRACDALLLKVNQVGTLTEALEANQLARAAGWSVTLSMRSGETEDNWAADLAVGWAADQFKNGSIRHSERLAKYNRMLEIAVTTGWPLARWPTHHGKGDSGGAMRRG